MAITSNTYTGNGSNKLFSITFPYLDTTDVDVYLNGVLQTAYSFANATTIEFVTAPANGVTVVLQRTTNKENLNSTFFPGSSIRASDLNENFDQLLYISQENTDVVNNLPVTVTMLRWKKTATAGQTVLTGNDDNAISLVYTAGFEQVYLNGAHLTRNADYTASDGATITMSVALRVGDLIEVMAYAPTTTASINSTAVPFTQSGTGAVTRNVDSKLKESVSVKDFGAVGDGTTNDTAAIQAALTSSTTSVFFPAGRYRVTSNLTRSGHTYLYGETMTSSILQMEGTSSFVYTGGTAGDEYNTSQLQIERLSFECPTYAAKAVVDISWTGGSGGTSKTLIIRDCEITGTNSAGGFVEGIKLTNARNVTIDNVRILGDRDAAPILSGTGVAIYGSSDPVEIMLDKVQVYFCTTGVDIQGPTEGVYITNCTVIACNTGVAATSSTLEPLICITASHFNTDLRGVNSVNYLQQIIQGNLFYAQGGVEANVTGYTGLDLTTGGNPFESIIADNIFQNLTTGIPANGVFLNSINTATTESIVTNNLFRLFDTAVILSSGTSNATVQDNKFISCSVGVLDSGTNNFIGNFGEFSRTTTSGLSEVFIENKSSANNTTKQAGFSIKGRDTVATTKDVAAIRSTPQDANWVNATTVLYGRNTDAFAPYALLGINGSPEGVVTAPVGAIATRRDGGASTTLYVKQSGTGNTGWVAK
jgi:hypothetical protein